MAEGFVLFRNSEGVEATSGTLTLAPNTVLATDIAAVIVVGIGALGAVTVVGGTGTWAERERLNAHGLSIAVWLSQQTAQTTGGITVNITTSGLTPAFLYGNIIRAEIYYPETDIEIPATLSNIRTTIQAHPAGTSQLNAATFTTALDLNGIIIAGVANTSDPDYISTITPNGMFYDFTPIDDGHPWLYAFAHTASPSNALTPPGTYSPRFNNLNDAGAAHLGVTIWIDTEVAPPPRRRAGWVI
jgi:hypothetical protein